MTAANIVDAWKVTVWRGVPGTINTNNYPICALVTRGLQQTKQTNTAVVPDCDDPSIAPYVKRTVLSLDATMSGEGYYIPEDRSKLQASFDNQTSQIWSFVIESKPASLDGYYSGKWHFVTLGLAAEQGQYLRSELAWEADGQITWTPLPPP